MELTVHKNTMERRKCKEIRDNLIYDARVMAKDSCLSKDIEGYAIVVWDKGGISDACWMRGSIPVQLIGEHFKQTMNRKLSMMDAKDSMEDKECRVIQLKSARKRKPVEKNLCAERKKVLTNEDIRRIRELLPFRNDRVTIADDGFTTIVPPLESGTIFINLVDADAVFQGIVIFSVDTGAASTELLDSTGVPPSQEGLQVDTGTLNGTTGNDDKFTISSHTDGKIYLENRTGASVNLHWIIFF